ncbi:MAG: hypothetical protein ACI9FY_000856, partial [Patiriisocius sp.]
TTRRSRRGGADAKPVAVAESAKASKEEE